MASKHYVYMIECGDKSIYTGYTTDVAARFQKHQAGKGAKYTRGRGPLVLKRVETFEDKKAAMQREYAIKKLSRSEKLQLLESVEEDINADSEKL